MQRFINNWSAALTTSAVATDTQLSIDPADAAKLVGLGGDSFYQPTLVEFSTVDGVITESAWEIIKITAAVGGLITVERGLEGTVARDWPVGAFIGLRVTAQLLSSILGRLEALETTEVPPQDDVVVLTVTVADSTNGSFGWSSYGGFDGASCDPVSFTLPAPFGEVTVTDVWVQTYTDEWSPRSMLLCLAHEFTGSQLASIEVEGIGTFLGSEALSVEFLDGETTWRWAYDTSDWEGGVVRTVTLTFNL